MLWVTAASVRPHSSESYFLLTPLSQQKLVLLVEEKQREGTMGQRGLLPF
jgi:hypothetical protein